MAFNESWDETAPTRSTFAKLLAQIIRNFKTSIRERLELEHYGFGTESDETNKAADGRHIPGKVGCMYKGGTAAVTALSGMGDGAIAYDTDVSAVKRYDSASGIWEEVAASGIDSGGSLEGDYTGVIIVSSGATPTSLVKGTVYQATQAGFVLLTYALDDQLPVGSKVRVYFEFGPSNPPLAQMLDSLEKGQGHAGIHVYGNMTVPMPKDYYFKLSENNGVIDNSPFGFYWIPLG